MPSLFLDTYIMALRITSESDHRQVRIRFNGVLHLQILRENHAGIQTWIGDTFHHIELYQKGSDPIQMEYVKRSTWERVIAHLEKHL